ncbi:MAG: thiamine pyrophosphate-dependent dehydrogenase E1 component subunit alpha [Planctomycetota bacterium]
MGKAGRKTQKKASGRPKTASDVRTPPAAAPAALEAYDARFLLGLHRHMILTRTTDDRIEALYKQGKLAGGCFSCRGQEACSVGSAAAVEPHDVIGPMIRNLGSMLRHGLPVHMVMRNYLGRATGPTGGCDGNTHFGALEHNIIGPISMLGSLIPVCAGAALAFRMRGEPRVALTWIGDGGSNIGDFHEGLNFAGVLQLPLVVVLENNQYAYSTPVRCQTAAKSFVCRAESYGIPGATVDGNDVLAVYETTREAVDRARAGGGPTLIEAITMRMRGHAIHDDAAYVPRELLEHWERRDPILLFGRRLREAGVLDEAGEEALREEVRAEVEAAVEDAMSQPLPDPEGEIDGVYA